MSNFIDQLASFLSLGDQSATVDNFGMSTANTGHNDVTGNNSTNTALSFQSASAGGFFGPGDDATAVNSASNLNASDGTAVVVTGSASAVGNVADTQIAQLGGGSLFGGIGINDQDAHVTNYGDATADTGHNTVTGNNSTNTALSFQDSHAGGFFGPGDDATAVNSAQNANISDGTAVLVTGNAQAVGNVADTHILQSSPSFGMGGIGIGDQHADVYNYGDATANTGHNTVTGNNSTNTALSFQDSHAGGFFGPGDDATAVNDAHNSNVSNGTAVLHTGNAAAVGNVADTHIVQSAPSFGMGGIGIGDQDAHVYNYGHATADTGHNTVTGNNSTNTALSFQDAHAGGGLFGPGDDATAVNSSHNSNVSDGHAALQTGDAHAVGNVAHTDIAQDQHHGDLGHFDFHM